MAPRYSAVVASKTPYGSIDGNNYAVWTYKLGAEAPLTFAHQVAIGFPADVDLKDPADYPDVVALSGTSLERRASANDRQRIVVSAPSGAPRHEVSISILATSAESSKAALTLDTKLPSEDRWTNLPFNAAAGSDNIVAMRGPASNATTAPVVSPPSPSPPKSLIGTLPYASELFGVYQPLLGWKARQPLIRIHREHVSEILSLIQSLRTEPRFERLLGEPLLVNPGAPVAGRVAPGLDTPLMRHLADQAATLEAQKGAPLTADDLKPMLSREALQETLRVVVQGTLGGGAASASTTVSTAPSIAVASRVVGRSEDQLAAYQARESAIAGTLAWLAEHSPQSVLPILQNRPTAWQQRIKMIDPFLGTADIVQQGVLSPIGLVHLYREYFFEFDTFLGTPVGHVWLSPGGTVELIEVNTRKTIQEQITESTIETSTKTEQDQTQEDDLSTAVKNDNQRDTKLAVNGSGGANWGVYHAEASASFNADNSRKTSEEVTHKQMRQQSEKLTSEIRRNFKTTFRTSTEVTDTTSRRYVIQNTTDRLINYELRRKMRKVGVQVQHVGTQLCWQVYLDDPGLTLGLAQLVHVASPADLASSPPPPDAPAVLDPKDVEFNFDFAYQPLNEWTGDGEKDQDYIDGWHRPNVGHDKHIANALDVTPPPPGPGYTIDYVQEVSHTIGGDGSYARLVFTKNPDNLSVHLAIPQINFGGTDAMHVTISVRWNPPDQSAAFADWQSKMAAYTEDRRHEYQKAYVDLVRDRIRLAGKVLLRNSDDLREEERDVIYRKLLAQLMKADANQSLHVRAELIRSMFDVDKMLYFVAPDWWKPRNWTSQQAVDQGFTEGTPNAETTHHLTDDEKVGWGGWASSLSTRSNYMVTEDSRPAPLGASLGWVLQLDGDDHRNSFLNSPFVKAIIPIRPGHERQALAWLQQAAVEGADGLDARYAPGPGDPPSMQNVTIREALDILADEVSKNATDMTSYLATETVFESGFDPLAKGFQSTTSPFQIFSQWVEILPTDQVVALEYDASAH